MFTRLLLAFAISSLLLACGDSGNSSPSADAAAAQKVGLLVTGSTSDGGWNQLAGDSLARLSGERKIQATTLQQVPKDKAADAIRQLESKGCSVIIAHGYEYLDVVKELADPDNAAHVNAKIAVSGGDSADPHFQSLFYDLSQASYQLGIIAGKVSKSGKLGFVGGAPFPTVTAMKRGFEAGARSVNPNITVAEQYTGWDDPSKAKKQVEAFLQQGCDVIMQNVDAASSGVFEAIKEHNSKLGDHPDAYTFGANSDQNANPIASQYILASAVIKMDKAFANVLDQAKSNSFKGGLVKEDLASGVCVAVLNPALAGKVIDADTRKRVDAATAQFAAGQITIPEK